MSMCRPRCRYTGRSFPDLDDRHLFEQDAKVARIAVNAEFAGGRRLWYVNRDVALSTISDKAERDIRRDR